MRLKPTTRMAFRLFEFTVGFRKKHNGAEIIHYHGQWFDPHFHVGLFVIASLMTTSLSSTTATISITTVTSLKKVFNTLVKDLGKPPSIPLLIRLEAAIAV